MNTTGGSRPRAEEVDILAFPVNFTRIIRWQFSTFLRCLAFPAPSASHSSPPPPHHGLRHRLRHDNQRCSPLITPSHTQQLFFSIIPAPVSRFTRTSSIPWRYYKYFPAWWWWWWWRCGATTTTTAAAVVAADGWMDGSPWLCPPHFWQGLLVPSELKPEITLSRLWEELSEFELLILEKSKSILRVRRRQRTHEFGLILAWGCWE